MDCKPTFTGKRPGQAGITLVETMLSMTIGLMLLGATVALWGSANQTFACVLNYVDLTNRSKVALDTLSREIRNAQSVESVSSTQLIIRDADGDRLTYTYDPAKKTLEQSLVPGIGTSRTTTLLTQCDSLTFSAFQRNPLGGSYDQYPAADAATAKVIQIQWTCARQLTGSRSNTERQISAKVVIRN